MCGKSPAAPWHLVWVLKVLKPPGLSSAESAALACLAWETTRVTEGNSSAKEDFPATIEGKEELKQVARHALGEEEPLCGVHTTGIVL